jgi:hypothetical protein
MLLLTVILAFVSVACKPNEGQVYFEDDNLERVIRQTINRPEGTLRAGDVMGITELDAREKEISSLDGVQAITNLQTLRLEQNKLSDISPLSRLKNLETLTLRGNEVSDLNPLAALSRLQVLDLRDNCAVDISPLAELTALVDLNLRGNGIEDISSLAGLTNLQELNIRDNVISDISVLANLSRLQDLNLRNNLIKDVNPLAQLANLTTRLYLEGNPVNNFRPLRYILQKVADLDIAFALSDPDFSVLGGFYTSPFKLKLTTYRSEGDIWYTLNGSEPDPVNNRANSFKYQGPLSISSRKGDPNEHSKIRTTYRNWQGPPRGEVFKATTVRARVFIGDQPWGEIETHTYFVDPNMNTRYSLPVISLTTDPDGFFGDKKGIYVPGDRYVENNDHTGNYWGNGANWERRANLEFYEADGEFGFSQGVGVRIHGGITRAWPQKTLRIYAREELGPNKFTYDIFPGHYNYGVDFDKFLLRNGGNDMRRTFMRDALVHQLVKEETDLDTQAWRPAVVFLNGEYWGIHNMRERFDEDYLQSKYGVNKEQVVILEGNAVKVQGVGGGSRHYKDMVDYVRNNSMANEKNYRYVQTLMDTDNYIDYMATEIWSTNTDWPFNNIRYWRVEAPPEDLSDRPGHDGRWRWLLYDLDYGLGLVEEPTFNSLSRVAHDGSWGSVLLSNLLKNQEFRNGFINRFADHLNHTFAPQRVNKKIDEMSAVYQPEMKEHLGRWPYISSVGQWETNMTKVRNWVDARPRHVRQHIISEFKLKGQADLTIKVDGGGTVKVNSLTITGEEGPWKGVYFMGVPVTLEAVPEEGYTFLGWQGSVTSDNATQILDLTGNVSLTAVFAPSK